MSRKNKIVPIIITSRESLEANVADIVHLKLDYASKTAEMEKEIAEVQKRHQVGILSVVKQIDIKEAGVFTYCQTHRKELFPEKKSIDTLLAVVGFRTNPPSIEKRSKKDTWDQIALRLAGLDWGDTYIREPDPEVNKRQLIDDRAKLSDEQLQAAGIRIEQDEDFYIEPKSQVAEASIREAA